MPQEQTKVGYFDNPLVSLTNDNSTRAVVLLDQWVGTSALAATDHLMTPRGGQRMLDGHISNTASACAILFYSGKVRTTAAGTMLAVSAAHTLTRQSAMTSTSFLSEGWGIGMAAMIMPALGFGGNASASVSNTGVLLTVIGVTGLALTFHSSVTLTAEVLNSGARIVQVGLRTRIGVTASAGNADSTPPISILGTTQSVDMASQPDRGLTVGADGMVLVAAVSALPALPQRVDITTSGVLKY